jgi:hypothetical protein
MAENDGTTTEARQILEGISAVAAERRREAQPALERQLPPWVLEVSQSEVVYTINPRALPLGVASFATLSQLLREKFHVGFVRPNLAIRADTELSDEQVGAALLRAGERVNFEGGRFMRMSSDFDVIRLISINNESIHVSVEGVSEIAELAVADVAEMVWAAAGAGKRWDEIRRGVQMVGYATGTLVDLEVPFEAILSDGFRDFAKAHLISGERFACRTGRRSSRHKFDVSPSTTAVWGLDDVVVKLFLFDSVTGRSEETRLKLSVPTRDTVGTGRIGVTSELPFHEHVKCIEALRNALTTKKGL